MNEERKNDIRAAGLKSRNAMKWLRDQHLSADPVCYTIAYEYLHTKNAVLRNRIENIDFTQNDYQEQLEGAYHQLVTENSIDQLSMKNKSTNKYAAEILSLLVATLEKKEDCSQVLHQARAMLEQSNLTTIEIDEYETEDEEKHEDYIKVKDGESRDNLTKLLDKNGLLHTMREAIKHPENYPMSIIHIDIDKFGQFNQDNGKTMGDAAIKHLGKFLTDTLRGSDVVSRGSDDNFILALPKTPVAKGAELAETMRKKIELIALRKKGSSTVARMTVSIGVTELTSTCYLTEAIARTVAGLNRLTSLGGNRVSRE